MWIENQKLEKPLYKTPCTVTKKNLTQLETSSILTRVLGIKVKMHVGFGMLVFL